MLLCYCNMHDRARNLSLQYKRTFPQRYSDDYHLTMLIKVHRPQKRLLSQTKELAKLSINFFIYFYFHVSLKRYFVFYTNEASLNVLILACIRRNHWEQVKRLYLGTSRTCSKCLLNTFYLFQVFNKHVPLVPKFNKHVHLFQSLTNTFTCSE
jgi:hypothetical protein